MKLKRILAGVAAASVAVSALAVSAFADALLAVQTEGGVSCGPTNNVYTVDTTSLTDAERASIATAEFTFTLDSDFMNGGGGYNKGGSEWTQPDGFQFSAAGENTYVMPVEDYALSEDGTDSLQVQVWWLNAKDPDNAVDGSATLDSVALKDADGNILLSIPEVEEVIVGNTNFEDGDPTEVIKPTLPGVLTYDPTQNNNQGGWRININHCWAPDREDFQILGDNVGKLTGAVAIGVHFDVSEFEDYGKPFDVDINLSADNKQSYWGDPATAAGVTTKPVTVDKDGDYIAWVMLDQPIEDATSNLFFMLDVQIDAPAPAEVEAGDGLPAIEVTEIGIQDGTPADPSEPEPSEPTPADPSEPEPSEPEPSEPQTPGECPGDPNGSGDDSGNTSVDNGDDNNPGTGVALAVVPAVLAAGALATATIVLKKRK